MHLCTTDTKTCTAALKMPAMCGDGVSATAFWLTNHRHCIYKVSVSRRFL